MISDFGSGGWYHSAERRPHTGKTRTQGGEEEVKESHSKSGMSL